MKILSVRDEKSNWLSMMSTWHWLAAGALTGYTHSPVAIRLSTKLSFQLLTTMCIARYRHLKSGVCSQCTSAITHQLRHRCFLAGCRSYIDTVDLCWYRGHKKTARALENCASIL